MCGIFGAILTSPQATEAVFAGLTDIEYRGYDSWGIAAWNNDKFVLKKEIGFLPKSVNLPDAKVAIGHTRWATHGGVTVENAHPHADCSGKLMLVHNGIVENFQELKSQLNTHTFKSQTDTEVIIHLIEDALKDAPLLTASVTVFNQLQGLNAFVVSDGKNIVAAKKGSPLIIAKTADGFMVASDPNALLPYSQDLLFMEDNWIVELSEQITLIDAVSGKHLEPVFTKVPWKHTSSVLESEFPHFMLKEMHEQPKVIHALLGNSKEIETIADLIKKSYGTFFVGCGTASYACLAGIYLFSKNAHRHVNFSIGSEFNYSRDFLTEKSLLVAVSQSGETIDTVEPVQAAKAKQTKIVAMTNVLGSTLYRMADYPLLLHAGVEKAVCSTKAFIAMISHMILLSYAVSGDTKAGQEILQASALEIEQILQKKEQIRELASTIKDNDHMYILGRGLSYPIALESALKIKEISYIHAEGFAGGELKHGVIALIKEKTPVIVYVPNDETKDAILSNAMEVKARGAYVIGIGPEKNEAFDYYFPVKDTGSSSILPHTVFAQLLGYYLSTELGLNPDKPRNLAKSVVVR